MCAARWATPFSYFQVFYFAITIATNIKAERMEKPINLNYISTIPISFFICCVILVTNVPQLASVIDLASLWFRTIPFNKVFNTNGVVVRD